LVQCITVIQYARVYAVKLKLMYSYIKIMLHVKIHQILKLLVLKTYVLIILQIMLCYVECVHSEQYYAQRCIVICKYEYIQRLVQYSYFFHMSSRIYQHVSIITIQYGVSLLCGQYVCALFKYAVDCRQPNLFPLNILIIKIMIPNMHVE
jgi:hypothetical protein